MKLKLYSTSLLFLCLLFGCSEQNKIEKPEVEVASIELIPTIDKPLPLDHSKKRTNEITHLMIHFISNAAVNPKDPYNFNDVYSIFEDYGLSVHYLIDREGNIYNLVSEDRVAYHAGKGSLVEFPSYADKMNEYSIGIELIAMGTKEEMTAIVTEHIYNQIDTSLAGFTEAQYQSLNRLVQIILKRNPAIVPNRSHVIGHDEYARGRKTDPGALFDWSKIGF